MNKAPLQIYSSALIFAPEKSIVREQFDSSIPLWVITRPIMQSYWDPCLATFETQHEHGAKILPFPTGDKFLFLSESRTEIWDLKTFSRIAGYNDVMSKSVTFSPEGNDLFYLTWRETLQVMSTATRSCIAEFRGHTDEITFAMFSPDGQQLASSSKDGSLKIWNRSTYECTATHHFNHGHKPIGFTPNGASFLIISNKTLRFLDSRATDRELTYGIRCGGFDRAVFSHKSHKLVSFESDDILSFTDISTGISLTAEGADQSTIVPLIFMSSGHQVICPMTSTAGSGRRDIGIWNTSTATCDIVLEGHRANITDIALSNDEKRIASASHDKSIRVWDAQCGSCMATYSGHGEIIQNVAFSTKGSLLISLDIVGRSKVWDINSEIEPQNIQSHGSAVLEVVLSPNKKRAVTTAGERTIKLWDTATGKCITTGEKHVLFADVPLVVTSDILSAPYDHVIHYHDLYGWPRSIQFAQDSSKFVSASENRGSDSIKLWNTNTGGYEPLYEAEHNSSLFMATLPNDMVVTLTSRDGTAMYWDVVTKKLLGSFGDESYILSYSAFSPDGTYLMLGYKDGVVRLYHLSTGNWRKMSEAHDRRVTCIAMSADGTRLASYGIREVIIWETDTWACIAKYNLASNASGILQMLFSPDTRWLIALYTTGQVKIGILCASTGHSIAQLKICGLANHIECDSIGSSLLITTNVGTYTLDPPTFREAKAVGLGLSNDGEWITWDSRNLLWLPPTFRISASDIDVAASLVALGSRLGRLLLIGIDSSEIPPPTATANLLDATDVP
jgi:WD40 repeat protein